MSQKKKPKDYAWMLKPISDRSKEIREKARIIDARRAGVKL